MLTTLLIIVIVILIVILSTKETSARRERECYLTLRYRKDACFGFGVADVNYHVSSLLRDYGLSDTDFHYHIADKAIIAACEEFRAQHPLPRDPFEPDGINIIEYQ